MTDLSFNSAIQEFLTELFSVKRVSQNTIIAYRKDLTQFSDFCVEQNKTSVVQISERLIRLYIIKLNDDNLVRSSISRKLSAVRGLMNYLHRNDVLNINPISTIKNPKSRRRLPETLDLDSYLKILDIINEDYDEQSSTIVIFELLYGSALRVSELCNLNITDYDADRKTLRILGKGDKTRYVPVGGKSFDVLNKYLSTRKDITQLEPLLLTNTGRRIYPRYVRRVVNKYISKVSDISKRSPHVLRHSAATHMLDRGADLIAVKEILGHENLSTTQIYTQVSVERLKKTYKLAHPKS